MLKIINAGRGRFWALVIALSTMGATSILTGCAVWESSDGRDSKMDEIDQHLTAIDTLLKAIPNAPPEARREKALAAKVHMDSIWETIDFLKDSFQHLPPKKKQAERFTRLGDKITSAGDKTVAALKSTQP
jgi:hypothetical protein